MKNFYAFKTIILFFLLFGVTKMEAQVTIGADSLPHSYSVLELYSQYKTGIFGGLRLPQMTSQQRDAIPNLTNEESFGLMIYNTDIDCVQFWNATKWVSLCKGCQEITGVTISPAGPISLQVSAGQGSAEFTANVQGTTTYQYEWYVNNALQTGAASATFVFNTPTAPGTYTVYANAVNTCIPNNTKKSNEVTINVTP